MNIHNLKVVLYCPQIPPNTGSIARTCAALNTELHLIKPINFSLSDKSLKRAGIDYWDSVSLVTHESYQDFLSYKSSKPGRLLAFSPQGKTSFKSFEYKSNDWIMHGREADGIPVEILSACDATLYIPMLNPKIRSLNLAVCASMSLYEAYFSALN